MNILVYLSRGLLLMWGLLAAAGLIIVCSVPSALAVQSILATLGINAGAGPLTIAVVVTVYLATFVACREIGSDASRYDGDGGDGGYGFPEPPSGPPSRRRLLPRAVPPRPRLSVPSGLTRLDTGAEQDVPVLTLPCDLDELAASTFLPESDGTLITRVVETPEGPVLFIVARGELAVGRVAGAHHALITGGPRIPVSAN